jgi:DNA-binding CsgD family transcriptional regulator
VERLDSAADAGGVVLIAGEAGVGKTRLMDEVASAAQDRKLSVLSGRCYEGGGTPPYWLWTQVVRAYLHNVEVRSLAKDLQSRIAGLRQIVPEFDIGQSTPGRLGFASQGGDFFIADGILALIEAATRERPLLLLLHDLHWASESSLQVLDFLCQSFASHPVLILASYRDDSLAGSAPLARTLSSLRHLDYCDTMVLAGLSPSETRDFLRLQLCHLPDLDLDGVVAHLQAETRGNPFYLGELARQIREVAESGASLQTWTPGSRQLPRSILDTFAQRLSERTVDCRIALTAASVIETSFDLSLVEQASGLTGSSLLDALEEAETAGLVEPLNGSMRYRFRLPIVRRAIYERIPRVRRDGLHWRVGCALRSRFGKDSRRVAEIAHHLHAGISVGDPAEAATWAETAGTRAFHLADYEESARWYQLGLEVLDTLSDTAPNERGRMLLMLGQTYMAAGKIEEAHSELQRAASEARACADFALLAEIGIAAEASGLPFARWESAQFVLLNESLEVLPEGEPVLRARVLARLSAVWLLRNDAEKARALADDAITQALRARDSAALSAAMCARNDSTFSHRNARSDCDCSDIMLAAESAADPISLIDARRKLIAERFEQADISAVERELQGYASLAIALRRPAFAWQLALWRAVLPAIDGDFDLADQRISEAYWIGKRINPNQASAAFGLQKVMIALIRDQMGELVPLLQERAEQSSQEPWKIPWRAFLAHAYLDAGQQKDASRELSGVVVGELESLVPAPMLIATVVELAPTLIATGDKGNQERLLALLRDVEDRAAIAFDGVVWFGPVNAYIGLLEAALGRKEMAVQSLESALALAMRASSDPWIVKTSIWLSRELLDRGRGQDVEHASHLLIEARRIAASHAMQKALSEIDREFERSQGTFVPAPMPFGLTEREVEVLRLLAAGRSSREIAEHLVISTRTAEHHVQNIYNKTGARRRVDAAALAGRHGLLPMPDR